MDRNKKKLNYIALGIFTPLLICFIGLALYWNFSFSLNQQKRNIVVKSNIIRFTINTHIENLIRSLKDTASDDRVINLLMKRDNLSQSEANFLKDKKLLGLECNASIYDDKEQLIFGKNIELAPWSQEIFSKNAQYYYDFVILKESQYLRIAVPVTVSTKIVGILISDIKLTDFYGQLELHQVMPIRYFTKHGIVELPDQISDQDFKDSSEIKFNNDHYVKFYYNRYNFGNAIEDNLKLDIFIVLFILAIGMILFYILGQKYFVKESRELEAKTIELKDLNYIQDAVLNSTSNAVIATDLNGTITYYNSEAEKMLVYTSQEVLHLLSIDTFYNTKENEDYINEVNECYGTNFKKGIDAILFKSNITKKPEIKEWTFTRKDGRVLPVRVTNTILRDKKGNIAGFLTLAEDITTQKRARYIQSKAIEKIEQMSELKSQFLANMSHEIRTPMNGVIGMTDSLLETELTSEQRDMITTLKKSGEILINIINDILDFSKIEAGKLEIEYRTFNLEEAVNDVYKIFYPMARSRNIDLTLNLQGAPEYFYGDELRLKQILTNLVSNAIKFTSEGLVNLELSTYQSDITIKVVDTGIGIPKDKLRYIFDAFRQADSTISRKHGGTGLGLAICNSLVKLMKGKINIKSKLNEGTTIDISLPHDQSKIDMSRIHEVHESKKEERLDCKGLKILLVEDNKINQKVVTKFLSHYEVELSVTENGRDAIDKYKEEHFDIILMDMQMPVMDGIEATKLLRSEFSDRPYIIAMTANAFKEDKQRCFDVGMNDFVSKPISKKAFEAALKKYYSSNISKSA